MKKSKDFSKPFPDETDFANVISDEADFHHVFSDEADKVDGADIQYNVSRAYCTEADLLSKGTQKPKNPPSFEADLQYASSAREIPQAYCTEADSLIHGTQSAKNPHLPEADLQYASSSSTREADIQHITTSLWYRGRLALP